MEIIEGKLYFIKDEFIEKYNPKISFNGEQRSWNNKTNLFLYCFRDKIEGIIATFTNLPEFINDIKMNIRNV